MIYDDILQWDVKKSEHFIFKYTPTIYNNIEKLIVRCETAYNRISSFLNVYQDKLFILYLCPNRNFCHRYKIKAPQAIPHQYCAAIIYDKKIDEINNGIVIEYGLGHEITHLLAYFWDKKMYHLEILEEGLAEYLDDPKSNNNFMHYMIIKEKRRYIKYFSLSVKPYAHTTNYLKAGSFVKFLIEQYGIEKFKELYVSTVLERKDKVFYLDGKKLCRNYLKKSLQQIYNKHHRVIQEEWENTVKSVSKQCQQFSAMRIKKIPGTEIFTVDEQTNLKTI